MLKKLVISFTVLLCLVLAVWMLYPACQESYLTWRKQSLEQAILNAYVTRNAQISAENSALESDQGIEDRARAQLGLVKKGEKLAHIKGLSDATDSLSDLPPKIDPTTIDIDQTWPVQLGDALFGYQRSDDD
ncbi:MAG: hypothetical protein LBL67_06100 [Coriobacteriales bacterium]|jgi:cell division protein FtsB|nr:hypothetical protein [Coriobacteriales bacterium]